MERADPSALGSIPGPASAGIAPARRTARAFVGQLRPPAFTLLELLIVLGIVATLAGIMLGSSGHAFDSGRAARARAELAALAAGLECYRLALGDYPRTESAAELLQALLGRRGPDGQAIAATAFIETSRFTTDREADPFTNEAAELVDPWGRAYRYAYKSRTPWTNPSYVLCSPGADGEMGGFAAGGFPDPASLGEADNLYAAR